MTDKPGPRTERVRTRRMHQRGAYDRATIDAILDAQPLAHVGYLLDGAPLVTPTLQWREGDHVYWHGSSASRMLERCDGAEVCVTVTLMDGMVMARSVAEIPVDVTSRASTVTAYAVPLRSSLTTVMGGRCSRSRSSPVMPTQM